jgi:hypothetical protein
MPGISRLEILSVVLLIGLALWILGTTINLARTGWVAIPITDDLDRWFTFLKERFSVHWFFEQHFDHRLAAPKLLFALDYWLFHSRGWFLLVCEFCLQGLTALMLWRISSAVFPQGPMDRWVQAAVLASCLFSGQQWVNFVWPFQVSFIMVYCAAAAALFALWMSAERDWSLAWFSASILLAIVASYSMANGVLVWPVLILAAVFFRMPWRGVGGLAVFSVLIGATYFYHWQRAAVGIQPPLQERLWHAVVFALTLMGSPLAPRSTPFDRLRNYVIIPGAIVAVALVIGLWMLCRRSARYNNARAALLLYSAFATGSLATIAYGRAEGGLGGAFEWRYLTPAYLLWICILMVYWPVLRQAPRLAVDAVLAAAILTGIALNQDKPLQTVAWVASNVHQSEVAIGDDVTDSWEALYYIHDSASLMLIANLVDYMRNHGLTVFSEEWTHWPGMRLSGRFSIEPVIAACQGQFEMATPVISPLKPGWRMSGWAWDNRAGRAPRYILLVDGSGSVSGVALTGFSPPPGVGSLSPRYATAGWTGYVKSSGGQITAYVLEADKRTLCAIGSRNLQPMISNKQR